MTKNKESKLRKIGIPASCVAITALVIEIICNNFNGGG